MSVVLVLVISFLTAVIFRAGGADFVTFLADFLAEAFFSAFFWLWLGDVVLNGFRVGQKSTII